MVGVLGGLKMVGFSGMLVGPLIPALLVALIHFWEEVYIKKDDGPSTYACRLNEELFSRKTVYSPCF